MKVNHVGMGVVIIEDLFSIQAPLLESYITWLKNSPENTFEFFTEDGETYAKNQTGFIFKYKDIEFAPQRFLDTKGKNRQDKASKEFEEIVDLLEQSAYKALVEYCKIFPDAATTSWWRPVGHIAGYKEGQRIGPHCDDQVPFVWGEETGSQVSMHNSVSINLYLNNCVEVCNQDNLMEYEGGELSFPNIPLTWKPKHGSAAIYPSNYIGRHEVYPVKNGERYAFLTMACYGTSFDNKEKVGEPNTYKIWMKDLLSDILR
jgi:predicted 2-oxoglutarate/Fe(II)-dependent dioxygenase YbiX